MLHFEKKGFDGRFKHSGDMGDIIYGLPVIKLHAKSTLSIAPSMKPLEKKMRLMGVRFSNIKTDGTAAGITSEKFAFLVPLLEQQEYIVQVKHQFDSTAVDLDEFRYCDQYNSIYDKYIKVFNVPLSSYETTWLTAPPVSISKVIISRSNRFQNENFPWSKILSNHSCVFVGLPIEHKSFVCNFGHVPFYQVKDAAELASVIAGAELFIGNQSLSYAIAESLKKNVIQESSDYRADCIFVRDNATFFLNNRFTKLSYLKDIIEQ